MTFVASATNWLRSVGIIYIGSPSISCSANCSLAPASGACPWLHQAGEKGERDGASPSAVSHPSKLPPASALCASRSTLSLRKTQEQGTRNFPPLRPSRSTLRPPASATKNKEPRTKNQEQGTRNQEPRTKNKAPQPSAFRPPKLRPPFSALPSALPALLPPASATKNEEPGTRNQEPAMPFPHARRAHPPAAR